MGIHPNFDPCPHCGCEEIALAGEVSRDWLYGFYAYCTECGCRTRTVEGTDLDGTVADVERIWNRRTPVKGNDNA